MAKIRDFYSFGDLFPHICPDKREILSGQRVAPVGLKTYFWTTE